MNDDLGHILRAPQEAANGAIVLLHGRGTNEYDLLPLLDELDPDRRLAGVTVRAPLNLPPAGQHWYRLAGIPTPDPESFDETFQALCSWLDRLPQITGVEWSRTVLGGFSQGCVMSYAAGLAVGRPSPAAILGLSGFMPSVPGLEFDLEGRAGLPVAIGHGSLDEVIPVEYGREASERLSAAGLDVTFHQSPVPHTIDPRFAAELVGWLQTILPR